MASEEPACPVCGNTDWEEGAEPFILRKADPRILRGGGTAVNAYICTRCEFVRLHRTGDSPELGNPSTSR